MMKNSHPTIPQVHDKKKIYTACDIKRADHARLFHNITVQQIKQILHAVDNKILQNLPIVQEDIGMSEDTYEPSIPHLKGKTARHKIEHVEPVKITSVPKTTLDDYKEVNICCDLMHINGIGLPNIISRHIMFSTEIMIKNKNNNNSVDGIMQAHRLYLQHELKIIYMHADSKLKVLCREMTDIDIKMNCSSKN